MQLSLSVKLATCSVIIPYTVDFEVNLFCVAAVVTVKCSFVVHIIFTIVLYIANERCGEIIIVSSRPRRYPPHFTVTVSRIVI